MDLVNSSSYGGTKSSAATGLEVVGPSVRFRRIVIWGVAALVCYTASACSERGAPPVQDLAELQAYLSELSDSAPIGRRDTIKDATLFRIRAARLSPDGQTVLAVDSQEPFLRFFDVSGELIGTAVGKGDGPREAQSVTAIDYSDDGSLLLVSFDRIRVLTYDGSQIYSESAPGFVPLGVVGACGGWFVYGPSNKAEDGLYYWLHKATFHDGQLRWTRLLPLAQPFDRLAHRRGWSYALRNIEDGIILAHPYPPDAALFSVSCDGKIDKTDLQTAEASPGGSSFATPLEDGEAASVRVGALRPGGLVALDSDVVIVENGNFGASLTDVTFLTWASQGQNGGRGRMEGYYRFLDSHPRLGHLIASANPVPVLFLLPHSQARRFMKR